MTTWTVSRVTPTLDVIDALSFNVYAGVPGVGVPDGGATGQLLAKASGADYDTEWVTGGGGGAPTNASYVTLGANASLTAERVLTAGAAVTITDAGANGTVTIAVTSGVYLPLTAGDDVQFTISGTVPDGTYEVLTSAGYARTYSSIRGLQLTAGTATVSLRVNGTPVTGFSAVAVTTTPQNLTVSAGVSAGQRVDVLVASASGASGLRFTCTRTRS